MATGARKDEHLRISLEEDVSFTGIDTGLDAYRFIHQALPELDLDRIDTTTSFLGHNLAFPLLVASMTGGTPKTGRVNRILAEAAADAGIGMGLGSMRAMLEHPEVTKTYQVRDVAPDLVLFANLGAVQLNYGYTAQDCQRLVDTVQADGLFLHLNPLQEALQPEGNIRFADLARKIETVCRTLTVPVIAKEVGWGLSSRAARMLIDAGVAALDVAGAGGTSWSQVEFFRQTSAVERDVAAGLRDWGIPTAKSLLLVRAASPTIPLIASGGLRTGIDIAKCLALGADMATMASVILRAAADSPESVRNCLEVLRRQLRIAMFVTGSPDVSALRHAELTGPDDAPRALYGTP
jgi:isopentenyl-diphosphate Delta-isomerase